MCVYVVMYSMFLQLLILSLPFLSLCRKMLCLRSSDYVLFLLIPTASASASASAAHSVHFLLVAVGKRRKHFVHTGGGMHTHRDNYCARQLNWVGLRCDPCERAIERECHHHRYHKKGWFFFLAQENYRESKWERDPRGKEEKKTMIIAPPARVPFSPFRKVHLPLAYGLRSPVNISICCCCCIHVHVMYGSSLAILPPTAILTGLLCEYIDIILTLSGIVWIISAHFSTSPLQL